MPNQNIESIESKDKPESGRYELSPEDLRNYTRELIARYPIGASPESQPFVCYYVDSGSPLADIGRHVEREVFEEKFGNSADEMESEYRNYDTPGAATFFIAVDRLKEEPTGVLRMIQNNPSGFKTLNDLADPERTTKTISPEKVFEYYGIDDPNTCWDAATLAVRKDYRGMSKYIGVMRYLTRSAYLYGMENNIHHVFMIMDKRAKEQAVRYLGIPYKPLAGLSKISYLGSEESYPMHCYYPEFLDKMKGLRMMTPARLMARKAIQSLKDSSEDEFLRIGE